MESFLREHYRLACQAVVEDDRADIEFSPLRRKPKILASTTLEKSVDPDPLVTRRGDVVYYDDVAVDRYRGGLYGIAIDLGTTTVVMDLVDLETGEERPRQFIRKPAAFRRQRRDAPHLL